MHKKGCSIIFFTEDNNQAEFLFFLRDDKDYIPYPNTWDLLGGNLEGQESSRECIIREIKEEIDFELSDIDFFRKVHFQDRIEHTFYKKISKNFLGDYDDKNVILKRPNEGQILKWFTIDEVNHMNLAFDFDLIVFRFYYFAIRKKLLTG